MTDELKPGSRTIPSLIDEFEAWIQPRIEKGHFVVDVIAAYCRTFPGRTIGLITNLYTHYQELDNLRDLLENMTGLRGDEDDDNRRPTSEQVRGVQETTDDNGSGGD